MHFERAEGGRQDLEFDAAVPMYVNRRYMVEFIDARVFSAGAQNKLEDSIYVTHTKLEYVAMMRTNALIDLRISIPWRFLSGSGADLDDWSPFSQGLVLDMLDKLSERIAHNGAVLLDPRLDIWGDFVVQEPKFQAYLDYLKVSPPPTDYRLCSHPLPRRYVTACCRRIRSGRRTARRSMRGTRSPSRRSSTRQTRRTRRLAT